MKRPGNTEKVSVSFNRDVLKILRRRAKRLHGGNLSAVLAEVAEAAARLEAQDDLIRHFGWAPLADAERAEIEAEWYTQPRKTKRTSAA